MRYVMMLHSWLIHLLLRKLPAAMVLVLFLVSPSVAATDWGRAVVDTAIRRHPDPATLADGATSLHFSCMVSISSSSEPENVDTSSTSRNGSTPMLMLKAILISRLICLTVRCPASSRSCSTAKRPSPGISLPPKGSGGPSKPTRGQPMAPFGTRPRVEGQLWADGAFMAVPFLVEYGRTFPGDGRSGSEAIRQLLLYAGHLQDPASGLLYHVYDETGRAPWLEPGTRHSQEFWCRAIGWYGMALIYALDGLGDQPGRPDLLEVLGKLVPALERYQDPRSGLWFQVVDKGSLATNWAEVSCSSMNTYVLLARRRTRLYFLTLRGGCQQRVPRCPG